MLVVQIFLPLALALVMFGLGLTLTIPDFTRVVKYPKAAVIALVCQVIILPAVCLGLVLAFGLKGVLAVGMMLLVASPGGTSANLFSHLAGGDVALNITLTAINSVLAVFTLPLVVGLSHGALHGGRGRGRVAAGEVRAGVRDRAGAGGDRHAGARKGSSAWALEMNDPVRIASVVVLVLVIIAAIARPTSSCSTTSARSARWRCCCRIISLLIGYYVPKAFKVDAQAGDRVARWRSASTTPRSRSRWR